MNDARKEDEMFCQNCNQRIRSGTSFCTGCGLSLAYAAHPRAAAAITIAKTIRLFSGRNSTIDDPLKRPFVVSSFAILYIAAAITALFSGFFTIANVVYALVSSGMSAESITNFGLGLLCVGLGGLWYFTGTGLWNLKPNSRIIHMVFSGLSILSLVGAPIAVLVFWYFTRPEIRILFSGKTESELTRSELEILAGGRKGIFLSFLKA
jgi:hypothetical protein